MNMHKNMIHFHKMNGLGNDFLIFLEEENNFSDIRKFLKKDKIKYFGDRHFGVGFDQLIFLKKYNNGMIEFDYEMIIFNSDGSKASFCGNATRCVAYIINRRREFVNPSIDIKIKSGSQIFLCSLSKNKKIASVVFKKNKNVFWPNDLNLSILKDINLDNQNTVQSNIYINSINNKKIFFYENNDISIELCTLLKNNNKNDFILLVKYYQISYELKGYYINIGNPHIVFFTKELLSWKLISNISQKINEQKIFKNGVNIGFCFIIDDKKSILKVFERGAGLTFACGSGACASFLIMSKNNMIKSNLMNFYFLKDSPSDLFTMHDIEKINSFLNIKFNKNNQLVMNGGFEYSFSGDLEI